MVYISVQAPSFAAEYHTNHLKKALGHVLCSHFLFTHAITGCDTTSRIFGIGKKTLFHRFVKENATLQASANTFCIQNQTADTITDQGI